LLAEELLEGKSDITRIALFVDLTTELQARLAIEVTALRFLENGRHVGGDRVRPRVAVITGIVAVQVAEIGNESRARIDRQKNFLENRIGNHAAIIRLTPRMAIVEREVE